jgi:pyrophosphatase PpaX
VAIKAVVFDSDGTLLNSFELIVAAYEYVSGQFGYKAPTADEVRPQLGKALPDIYRALFPGCDADAMVRVNSEFISKNATRSAAFQGLNDMLQELEDAGLKLAILTGGNHKIHDLLEHHRIKQHFSSIVHCEQVVYVKPDPEGFFKILDELLVEPFETIMVGDTPNDIFTGKNGHAAATIGITHGYGNKADLIAADADYIVDSLKDLTARIKKLATEA